MAFFRCGGGGHSDAEYNNLMDQLVEETTTGPIASFTDGANNIPAKEIICHINPTQTGTGTKSPSNPYVIGGFTEANLTRTGKNLFDKNLVEVGKWLNVSTGAEESAGPNYSLTNYIFVKGNISYTMTTPNSSRRWFYDLNKQPVTIINNDTFTPTKDGFIRITIFANVSLDSFQIEVGSTATAYEPYITPVIYNVPFGQTVYGGEFVASEGEYNKVTGDTNIITFDGSNDENWLGYSLGDGWQITIPDMKRGSHYDNSKAVCNVFNKVNNSTTLGARIGNNNQIFYLVQVNPEYSISSLADLKTWLSINPVTITYPVDTPSEITLPIKTQLNTLLGANNFYHDCNGDIDVTYRANGALYVQEHPITRGLMAARPTEQIQEQEEQQEEKEINKSEDNEK